MHSAEQEAFEDKLAHLNASNTGFWRRVSNSLLRTFWWCCCCFWFASDPYKPETKEWAVLTADDHVARPAHLKISTSDQRAVEIKIVYAVNPNVASQLYEVDVFMFFLQDLEAVSINFYHDLWQSVRLHTPKTPLAALANDPSAGFIDLIEHQLQAIQSKQAAGDAAAVQQDVDRVVQQLRLHVCIYRNSVRRAMKSIAQAVEQLEATQAGAAETADVARAVMNVVTQIAQSLHRLQLACTPCQTSRAPEQIRAVWRLVDEYALAESERATLKLLRGLDKHIQHVQTLASQAAAAATVTDASEGQSAAVSSKNLAGNPAAQSQGAASTTAQQASGRQDAVQQPQMVQSFVHPQQELSIDTQHAGQHANAVVQQPPGVASQQRSNRAQLHPHHMDVHPQQHPSMTHLHPHQMAADPRRTVTADQPSYSSHHNIPGMAYPLQDPSMTPMSPPVLVRSSGSRVKLEYRLSQNDIYLPSAAELSTLMQQPDKSRLRWTVDDYSRAGSQASSAYGASRRPSTDVTPNKQQQQHHQNSSFWSFAAPGSANGLSQPQQNGLPKQGSAVSGLAAPTAISQDVVSTEATYANPLVPQHLDGEQQELQQGGQQRHLKETCQLPPQSSNMAALIQKADAAQALTDGMVDSSELKSDIGEWQNKLDILRPARQLILDTIMQLQDERRERGCLESILVPNAPSRNEAYTNCIKCLKHNARAAVVLKPELLPQSFLLQDIVGMVIAGLAMCLACGAIFVATRFSRNQLSGVYVTIIVVGYMLKDRLKEWGKRYLQPSAMKFGFEFPDRTVKMRDSRGRRVGRCKEWVKVVADSEVDARVLAMRHKDKGHIPPERHATKPERVLAYRKKMEVAWQHLDPHLRGVDGLDDIMRFDLQHFCRRMQPPNEPHYCLETSPDGSVQVQKVQCARVYHINVVLRIRTSVQDVRKDKSYREKSLQIQRARIIMDQTGIKRLEATDDSVHLMGDRHPISASPAWRPEVRMSGLHLPRVSMPRLTAFGRHSAQPLQPGQQPEMSSEPLKEDMPNYGQNLVEHV